MAYSDMALVGNCIQAGIIGLRNAGFFLFSGYLMKIKKDEIIGLETG